MIAGTAFLAGDLSEPDFDATTYDSEVAKFVENENKSLAVYNMINSAEPQYLIKEFSNGIVLWKENKEIVNRLSAIENLPTELLEQNKKLLSYCDLRIQHNEIIVKAISEDTDKYVSEIDRIGMEINKVLKELEEFKK
jgi:DNA-binding transcriptional regulator WhiA